MVGALGGGGGGGGPGRGRGASPGPLRRIVFQAAALGCAFLLLAVLILWPVSYFRDDKIWYRPGTGWECHIGSWAGRFEWYKGTSGTLPAMLDHSRERHAFVEAWRMWSYGDRSKADRY